LSVTIKADELISRIEEVMKRLLFIYLLFGALSLSWAEFPIREARITTISPSGKTAIINMGSIEGVKEQDYAVLVKKVRDLKDSTMRLVPVAKTRFIKVDKNRSFLILFRTFSEKLLQNDLVLVLTESDLLSGRAELNVGRNKIISPPSELAKSLHQLEQRDKDLLSKKEKNYRSLQKNFDIDQKFNDEFVLTDVEKWKVIEGEDRQVKMPESIYRSEFKEDFIQKKRLETFEKLVVNFLQKVNRPGFDYAEFYYKNMRDPVFHEFREGLNYQNEYLAFLEEEAKRNDRDAYLYRQLLEKGQSWSEEFTDDELERLLGRVGVVYEQERRRVIMSNRFKFQGHLTGGFNFLDNENRFDNQNARSAKWHSEVGVRFFPFNQVDKLNQLAFEGQFKYGVDGVSLGTYNAQSTETSGTFYVVFYPFASPYVVDKNSFYIAIGGKTGFANLSVPSLNDSANYSSFALPVLQTGLIYNFISGYGLRISLTVEKSSLEKVDSEETGSVLPRQTTLQEGRLAIGLTKFF